MQLRLKRNGRLVEGDSVWKQMLHKKGNAQNVKGQWETEIIRRDQGETLLLEGAHHFDLHSVHSCILEH